MADTKAYKLMQNVVIRLPYLALIKLPMIKPGQDPTSSEPVTNKRRSCLGGGLGMLTDSEANERNTVQQRLKSSWERLP